MSRKNYRALKLGRLHIGTSLSLSVGGAPRARNLFIRWCKKPRPEFGSQFRWEIEATWTYRRERPAVDAWRTPTRELDVYSVRVLDEDGVAEGELHVYGEES